MSAEAQATLQQLWEKLDFSTVKRTIAREPEDVLFIRVYDPVNRTPIGQMRELFDHSRYKRMVDVPEELRPYAEVSWRHYYGFTVDDIFFQNDDYHGLDMDIDLTMDWSRWGNHTGGYDRPKDGQLIYGEVVDTPEGRRFNRWYMCNEAFKLLVTCVRNGTDLSEDELGRKLFAGGSWPDVYWGLARLVLFDNVQAFVNQYLPYGQVPPHPAEGMPYGERDGLRLGRSMSLPGMSVAKYVHTVSWRLNQSQWWQEFLAETARLGLKHGHFEWPARGRCPACAAEGL